MLFDPICEPLAGDIARQIAEFREFGRATQTLETRVTVDGSPLSVPTFVNEFWTSKQRAASSLHEISYRACFKPQLPRFFIERLTRPGEVVYDPFMGRGTTLIEAALNGRVPCGCDANPLSADLVRPRLSPPSIAEISSRLRQIDLSASADDSGPLLTFYHPETLRELSSLRHYLLQRRISGRNDHIDDWIRMVAINRLTGHSPGFLSVYTMPPNQAVSIKRQEIINRRRGQTPPRRRVIDIILKKSAQLLSDLDLFSLRHLSAVNSSAKILTGPAAATPRIDSASVALVVTSPPFLNIVDYAGDNWLRCWFIGIDPAAVKLSVPRKLADWQEAMSQVFLELHRVVRGGGWVAFEVGEIRSRALRLEEAVLPCGLAAGFEAVLILINDQKFTKTANCWGVDNNEKGTNTNRIVLFRKPA